MSGEIFEANNALCNDSAINILKETDLNSLVFFVAFMQYKTLYNASIALDCSPALVSLMLKKFKLYFDVPLFTREGRQLTPTDFAIALEIEISHLLNEFISMTNRKI